SNSSSGRASAFVIQRRPNGSNPTTTAAAASPGRNCRRFMIAPFVRAQPGLLTCVRSTLPLTYRAALSPLSHGMGEWREIGERAGGRRRNGRADEWKNGSGGRDPPLFRSVRRSASSASLAKRAVSPSVRQQRSGFAAEEVD